MRTLVLTVLAVVVVGAVAALLLRPGDRGGPEGTSARASASARPTPALRAAPVDGPVARVATGPADAGALSLVREAPSVVLAGTTDHLAAAHLALRLRAPLVVVDDGAREVDAASERATDDASARVAGDGADRATDGPTATATAGRDARVAAGSEPTAAPTPDGAVTVDEAVAELRRVGATTAVVVGPHPVADAARGSGVGDVVQLDAPPEPAERTRAIIRRAAGTHQLGRRPNLGLPPDVVRELLAQRPPPPDPTGAAALVHPDDRSALPAVVTARAVGHLVVPTAAGDLRGDGLVVRRIGRLGTPAAPPAVVLAGARMASRDPAAVAEQIVSAATGRQLPGGGQLVIDPDRPRARRYIGLYGTPGSGALGVLGEQPVDASVQRVRRLARRYRAVVDDDVTIVPTFEIIATIASAGAGGDGNFSNERPLRDLRPMVDAARRAGVYVLLDLQPGRTDFLTQAKRYRPLLRQPHVGLALDPEWRLRPGERHLEQIGSVGVAEVNEVGTWLADLVERERLPQKLYLLHQFRTSMIRNRQRLDTSREELAHVIQMDGQGPQGTKLETWRTLLADRPGDVRFGWKNFYDEDSPVRSPAETMALRPTPVFVSYQ